MRRVLVAGVSTRAAAESLARAGFSVTAIDAFGDLDQHRLVHAVSLEGAFTARAAARAARRVECDAVVYLANFENHPKAVKALAEGRALWGNPPEVIRRVRDPLLLAEVLRTRRLPTPRVRLKPDTSHEKVDEWLLKPLASGGGQRIRRWQPGEALPAGCYVQELINGDPGSVVFVAAGGRAVLLGISRQLVGEQAFGASAYQYCGNILAEEDLGLADAASALVSAVTEEFGLVGVNGVDFVVRDGKPYAIEVNPRWSASMELVERAWGFPVLAAHASACAAGALPVFDLRAPSGAGWKGPAAFGKAVVYARRDVAVGDTQSWLSKAGIRDIPRPGERIPAGRPVCTVFATGRDRKVCHEALIGSAGQVYAQLDTWGLGRA